MWLRLAPVYLFLIYLLIIFSISQNLNNYTSKTIKVVCSVLTKRLPGSFSIR